MDGCLWKIVIQGFTEQVSAEGFFAVRIHSDIPVDRIVPPASAGSQAKQSCQYQYYLNPYALHKLNA